MSVQILIRLLGQIEIVHHSKLVGLIGLVRNSSTGLDWLRSRDSFVGIGVIWRIARAGAHPATLKRGFLVSFVDLLAHSRGFVTDVRGQL